MRITQKEKRRSRLTATQKTEFTATVEKKERKTDSDKQTLRKINNIQKQTE